ncbi:phage baseplate protein [Leptolyngbya sp. FACHB-17]|uniref:T4 family baseplate hub assembly chaperone n=1 Tax=unclassified Leptolyngbya TaxID=2650499 RepID=UPI0016811C60|nr:phage baseplate protein [Leptolyngbya sp. FACHB-17]MBD2080938.1 phage baseplate protein [Leptolyngbya sp. FACHB-17]
MRPLSSDQIIRIWERGQRQHPVDRALSLLAIAFPDAAIGDLARLTVGQRDVLLLTLREITFGKTLNCFAECPHCSEALEFSLSVDQIRLVDLSESREVDYGFDIAGFEGRFRLPNSFDMAAIVSDRTVEKATASLLDRCLLQATHNGTEVSHQELPPQVVAQLAAQMAELDPQAETLLDLCCPACEYDWQILLDIVSFFWTELSAQAKRLLLEVHQLARHYSWQEADILAMSATRRNLYLELLGS